MSQNIGAAKISIIIPVLNETGNIKEAIPTVGYANATTQPSKNIEVIIVHAGSEDGTVNTVQLRLNSLSKSIFLTNRQGRIRVASRREERKGREERAGRNA